MSNERQCPLCEKCDSEFLTELKFAQAATAILPSEYRIVCCRNCGFVYDDVPVGADVFRDYYAHSVKYVQSGIGGSGDISNMDRIRYESIIKFMEPALKCSSVSIADIGCGKGGLLRVLKEHGYTSLYGFDPSTGCMDILRGQLGISATCAEIAELGKCATKHFDVVVVSNVFEHLYTIHDAIASVDKIVNDGGFVYVDVPDGSRYNEHFYAPFYSFDMEHINHFNVDMMVAAWARHGYECLKSEELVGTPVPGRHIPMCRMLFKKTCCVSEMSHRRYDGPIAGIKAFIKKSQAAEKALEVSHIPVGCCYWGCGAYAKWLLHRFSNISLGRPSLIFDTGASKKNVESINGVAIVNPSELNNFGDKYRPVVITSVLYEQQILENLGRVGWRGPIYSGSTGLQLCSCE